MTPEDAEPMKVGDLIPEVLETARAAGAIVGPMRATRPPRAVADGYRPRGKTGRPTRLHPGLMDEIAAKVEDGCPIEAAAISSGVPASTYHSWMARGREARAILDASVDLDPKELIFLEFLERMEGSRASAMAKAVTAHQRLAFGGEVLEVVEQFDSDEDRVVGRTIRFSKPDRMALEWYLERSHPTLFGTRRVEITGDAGGPIPVEVEVSARDILRKKIGAVAARLGEDDPTDEAQAS